MGCLRVVARQRAMAAAAVAKTTWMGSLGLSMDFIFCFLFD